MILKLYAVPATIAAALKLTRLRKMDAEGNYLLSAYDLQGYGIDRALREGAEELSAADARARF
jgi:hypothetical protein